jgi:hypothetical protein
LIRKDFALRSGGNNVILPPQAALLGPTKQNNL